MYCSHNKIYNMPLFSSLKMFLLLRSSLMLINPTPVKFHFTQFHMQIRWSHRKRCIGDFHCEIVLKELEHMEHLCADKARFLMTSSEQSTSSSPPITTGKRLGFTWQKRFITQSVSHHHPLLQEQTAEMIIVIIRPQVPSERRSRCTSAGCCGTSRARGRGQSQSGHTQWWEAVGRLVLLPVKDKVNYCFE